MQRELRLNRELAKMAKKPPTGISVSLKDDKSNILEVTLSGPEDSPYSAGIFKLEVLVPDNYPFSPPSIKFLTKVYHPNIDDNGRICLDLIKMPPKGSWRPTISIEGLLVAIRTLLKHPNPDDPLMSEIAEEFLNHKTEFERKAKLSCDKHASLDAINPSDVFKQIMEPKLVKEEVVEKDNYIDTTTNSIRTRSSKGIITKERCKTPDSPEGARVVGQPLSPTQSSPQRPSTNGASSPVNNGSADSLTPPPPAVSASLSVSLDNNQTPLLYNHNSNYNSCVVRPLVKVKRFLSTLVQFGNDISSDIGERVRSLVLNLVSSNLSIEEFHHSLQDVTNFPLRPFVLPFLRAHLPLLQREVHTLARTNKQSALQYVRSHDHVILDPAHSPSEASEIFMSAEAQGVPAVKRRASDSIYENGVNGQPQHDLAPDYIPLKRPATTQNSSILLSQNLLLPNHPALGNSHFFDYSQHTFHGYNPPNQHRTSVVDECGDASKTSNNGRVDEEWRNIHVMLNCILSMVEKTKRALTILQQRHNQELTGDWFRRQDVSADLKRAANEIMTQAVKQTEDRVAEVKRKAEEAVNDVKRQAVVELQKAAAVAESKANELVASERAKMEKLLMEARKHPDDNNSSSNHSEVNETSFLPAIVSQTHQQNTCWNCGRKAHETCSGCNVARYCGAFCQHKDWENHHHQACTAKEKMGPLRASTPSAVTAPPSSNAPDHVGKFKK